ncbi:MAG TPA: hypothetical protein VGC75_00665 [Candidatus Nitrosocosmicus sp.]
MRSKPWNLDREEYLQGSIIDIIYFITVNNASIILLVSLYGEEGMNHIDIL